MVDKEPAKSPEFGHFTLDKPWRLDALKLGSRFFPTLYYKTAAMADGSVYVARTRTDHSVDQTVLLFEKPSPQGFRSVYSPLPAQQLKEVIIGTFTVAEMGQGFLRIRRIRNMCNQLLSKLHLN